MNFKENIINCINKIIFKDIGMEIKISMDLEWVQQVYIMDIGLTGQKIYLNISNM
jgi:hypothetical protein